MYKYKDIYKNITYLVYKLAVIIDAAFTRDVFDAIHIQKHPTAVCIVVRVSAADA